jgi:hypothetical protein
MIKHLILNFWALLLLLPLHSFAQEAAPAQTQWSLFDYLSLAEDSLPVLQLETDWGRLIRKKRDKAYQEGTFRFVLPDGNPTELTAQLRTRGNMRKEVCYYPPLQVKFKKKSLQDLGFNDFNKLKLVLSCKNGPREEAWLLREYLAYKLYEELDPDAYLRTALLKIQGWQDGRERFLFYGLIVEHEEELSARLDAPLYDKNVLRIHALERDNYVRVCFFQYMIYNTDWAVHNRHNLRAIKLPEKARLTAIPYDFDYAGFVGTDYAVPHSSLPIKSVQQQHFMGFQITEEEAQDAAAWFLARKARIMERCETFGYLDERSKRTLLKNLTSFFELLEDEKKMKRVFVNAVKR